MANREREELPAVPTQAENQKQLRAFMAEADPDDPQGRTRQQRVIDSVRTEALGSPSRSQREAAKLLARWEARPKARK
jgi:hypothetical protein